MKVILSLESGSKSQAAQKQLPIREAHGSVAAPAAQVKSASKAPVATHVSVPAPIATAQVSQVTHVKSRSANVEKALSIIAEESGVALEDLTDGTDLADCGVDSLLGLTIQARLKEELDQEVDFNALLFEYPTVGELKAFFGGVESTAADASSSGTTTPTSSTGRESTAPSVQASNSSSPSIDGDVSKSGK